MPRPRQHCTPIGTGEESGVGTSVVTQSFMWTMTVAEVRAELGVREQRVWELMKAGVLRWTRPGRRRLICRASVAAYLERHERGK